MNDQNKREWLLLIHQILPKPNYFRVKIWRRLLKIGAVAIKQSVYVLPDTGQAYEDLHWIVKEIIEGGGTASLSKAVFFEGLSNGQIKALFQASRDDEYEKIIGDAQSFISDWNDILDHSGSVALQQKKILSRIKSRFDEIVAIDFFDAPARSIAGRLLAECDALLRGIQKKTTRVTQDLSNVEGKTWVTRQGIYVDRIACAWLIRRFIDPNGKIKFVVDETYQLQPNELRFDMFEGEFTHIGDKCSFEVLVESFGLSSKPIIDIAEIVHDIDLKDNKYNRTELSGIQAVFSGLVATQNDDQERLERGSMIFDELYASFGGKTETIHKE